MLAAAPCLAAALRACGSAGALPAQVDYPPSEMQGAEELALGKVAQLAGSFELGPLKVGEGQPVLDGYALFMPTLIGFPGKVLGLGLGLGLASCRR